jgi:hypothetical protein
MRTEETMSLLFEQPNVHGDVPDAPKGSLPSVPLPAPDFVPPKWDPEAVSDAD